MCRGFPGRDLNSWACWDLQKYLLLASNINQQHLCCPCHDQPGGAQLLPPPRLFPALVGQWLCLSLPGMGDPKQCPSPAPSLLSWGKSSACNAGGFPLKRLEEGKMLWTDRKSGPSCGFNVLTAISSWAVLLLLH